MDELENLLFSGGRKYTDQKTFDSVVDAYLIEHSLDPKKIRIVHGKAPGLDTCADTYAKARGIDFKDYPARWDDLEAPGAVIKTTQWGKTYNAKAGHDRNAEMRTVAQRVVAFWDGRSPGTREMVYACLKLGLHLTIYYYDPDTFQIIKTKVLDHDTLSPRDL